jgi:Arc/MetJ-type ribon-helix-helix transcriptional regulator
MQIEISPETERLVREEINRGHFRSVEEMIHAAVEAWRVKQTGVPEASKTGEEAQPFWKSFTGRMHSVPGDVFDELPTDGAAQHDHYLYGSPKRGA